jgi:hypothetical protein
VSVNNVHIFIPDKKSLKIPKRLSESVLRRMANRKRTKGHIRKSST